METNDSESATKNLPEWAKLFLHLGFPTAVAMLLLAALLGWIQSPMMQAIQRMEYQAWYQSTITRVMCYQLAQLARSPQRDCEPWKQPVPVVH